MGKLFDAKNREISQSNIEHIESEEIIREEDGYKVYKDAYGVVSFKGDSGLLMEWGSDIHSCGIHFNPEGRTFPIETREIDGKRTTVGLNALQGVRYVVKSYKEIEAALANEDILEENLDLVEGAASNRIIANMALSMGFEVLVGDRWLDKKNFEAEYPHYLKKGSYESLNTSAIQVRGNLSSMREAFAKLKEEKPKIIARVLN